MKLRKVTSNDPVERLSASVRHSTIVTLEAYRAYYKSVYGDDIERSQLVEEMLLNFMGTDKDFQKFLDKASEKPTTGKLAADASHRKGNDTVTGFEELEELQTPNN